MKFIRNIFFSRITFLVIGILLQLTVFFSVIYWFNEYFSYFYTISIIFSFIIVLIIVNNDSNPAYKIAWIIPILIFPIFGGIFYMFFGSTRLSKRVKQKMTNAMNEQKIRALQTSVLDEIKAEDDRAAFQSQYIEEYAFYPPYKNTYTEYLPLGEVKFERLLDELQKAKRYIFLEYFIIKEGHMWDSILNILIEKVKEGVDVRIIYDDIGCIGKLPYRYDKYLERLGIQCLVFNPFISVFSPWFNHRDHRKIVVIDGEVGFTGGINISDEYINAYDRFGHWKDSALLLKGEAVWSLTVMFLTMWSYLRDSDEDIKQFKPNYPTLPKGLGYVQPFADTPLDGEPVGESVYLNLINKAKNYIYICTPYLIIDNELLMALSLAAKGGVDVKIITPHRPDKWYVHLVTRSYYLPLIKSGVEIHEYTPGFIHSKTIVVDDQFAVVGTINLDFRSFYLHFECGVWLYNNESVLQVKNDFLQTLAVSKQKQLEDVVNTKWYKKLLQFVLRIFSPLM